MTEVDAARVELLKIVRDLEAIRSRLLEVQESLPPSPLELDPLLDFDDMDSRTEIRAVIGCVLHDSIRPAIRDLRNVAVGPSAPGGAGEREGEG